MNQNRGISNPDCLIDGELSAYVGADNRGLAFGDGVWERLVVVNGEPWWWQDHIDRLKLGCERLGLAAPPQSVLLREVQTVAAGRARSLVKIILTRGGGSSFYLPEVEAEVTRVVMGYPWPEAMVSRARRGARARLCETRLAVQPALGGINHLNRLERVLAAREMAAYPEMEGFLLDTNDHLISALDSNIFLVMGDQLLTPRMDRSGVRGILRGRIARAFKARTELRRITLDMLPEADEVILCDVVRGIVPVISVGGWSFNPGPVTAELQTWLEERRSQQ
jgi:4-amino-4-deoxychorismate lyase